MGMETVLGISLVIVGGLIMGACAWPMKLMRTFQFEHWWFLAMLVGLVLGPWTFTLAAFPNFFNALCDPVVQKALIIANILALCWGVANILCGLCYVRIGIALTQAILTGLGVSVVVLTPMIFKAKGSQFEDGPDINSLTGETILAGVGVMLLAVVLASLAGFGRDRQLQKQQQTSGSFLVGLIMTVIAGITSAGLWLAFIYCEGPIQSRVCMVETGTDIDVSVKGHEVLNGKYLVAKDGSIALKNAEKGSVAIESIEPIKVAGLSAKSAADKIAGILGLPQPDSKPNVKMKTPNALAVFPVWAAGAFSGAMLNILFPAFLMTRRKSWGVLLTSWKEVGLAAIIGVQLLLALTLPGKGMLMLGALGAAIGTGIQQAMQMVGGQGTGFISGEWRGVHGKPRLLMYGSIALLIIAAFIMAYSKTIKQ
jgi:L-rhamnose-proton symport protein (RhaT)